MRKYFLTPVLLLYFFVPGCVQKPNANPQDKTLTAKEATEELRMFTGIIKKVHPSLYLYISNNRFEFLTDSLQSTITGDITRAALFNKYAFLVNSIGCSHTSVDFPGYIYDTLENREYFFPYAVKLVDGQLLVNATGLDLAEGTVIKEINGVPAGKLLKNIAIYNTIDGAERTCQHELAAEDFSLYYFFKYGAQKEFKLIVTDTNGVTKQITKYPVNLKEWNNRNYNYKYYFDQTEAGYDLDFINKGECAVLRLSTFDFEGQEKQQAFENFCRNSFDLLSRKPSVKRLVIDLRENTGGDLYNCFLLFSYLAPQSFREYEKVVSRINEIPFPELLDKDYAAAKQERVNKGMETDFTSSTTAGYYVYTDSLIQTWYPQDIQFKGKVFVVTNARVASAASYFSLLVKKSGAGKIVGEETAGSANSGNGFSILEYTMPKSEIKLLLPYAHMIYTYKEENRGQGVKPDYYIPDNLLSFKKNKDRQIAFINDSLNKN